MPDMASANNPLFPLTDTQTGLGGSDLAGTLGNAWNSYKRWWLAGPGIKGPAGVDPMEAALGFAGGSIALEGSLAGIIKGFHGTPHTFEPVEHNPFGEAGPRQQFVPVDHDPFATPGSHHLVSVDHDPFAPPKPE